MYAQKFQSLTIAQSFVARAAEHRNHLFIFDAPDSGYLVVDHRTAKQLWAEGHEDIR